MKLNKFFEQLTPIYENIIRHGQDTSAMDIGVSVHRAGSIGSSPLVGFTSLNVGFDWDHGKLILIPEKVLRESSLDEAKAIEQKYGKIGTLAFENQRLTNEVQKLKDLLAAKDDLRKVNRQIDSM